MCSTTDTENKDKQDKKERTVNELQKDSDDNLLKVLEKKLQGEDTEFYELVKIQFRLARQQSKNNKKRYFGITNAIIFSTGLTTVVNAFITEGSNILIKLACVILPVVSSILLSIKNERKFDETWQRHVKRYVKLQLETSYYIWDIEKYEQGQDEYKKKLYKNSIMKILGANFQTFETNMDKPSKTNSDNEESGENVKNLK